MLGKTVTDYATYKLLGRGLPMLCQSLQVFRVA
jgi:hypothetical protein